MYPPELLLGLSTLGLAPTAATAPGLVRDAVNDLYRYELRRMRLRLRDGEIEKSGYYDRVVSLRKKYWMLSLPVPAWEKICREP